MSDNTKNTSLEDLTDADFEILAEKLDKLGITDTLDASNRVSARILSDAVDFMKNIGVLNEFVQSLPGLDKLIFIEMYTHRPKQYGGNPFD